MEQKEYIEIKVEDQKFRCLIAQTEREKEIGLSQSDGLDDDEGLLFVYDEVQPEVWYTCKDMSFPIDIVFMDENGVVLSVHQMEEYDRNDVYERNVQFVLEVNVDSKIEVGDKMEGDLWEDEESEEEPKKEEPKDSEDEDLTDDEKEEVKTHGRMLILDENGDVQMTLEGGERIVSRIKTRQLIKAAVQAYRSDNDDDYRKVGRIILKELIAQDGRDPQYVTAPDKHKDAED